MTILVWVLILARSTVVVRYFLVVRWRFDGDSGGSSFNLVPGLGLPLYWALRPIWLVEPEGTGGAANAKTNASPSAPLNSSRHEPGGADMNGMRPS